MIKMAIFKIMLRRGNNTEMKEHQDLLLEKGEPFLEFQDQYKGKWYRMFMNPVRVKYGDGENLYKDLPFTNRRLKPIAELFIEIGLIAIQFITLIIFLSSLYL